MLAVQFARRKEEKSVGTIALSDWSGSTDAAASGAIVCGANRLHCGFKAQAVNE
jgi:hypothetical protein